MSAYAPRRGNLSNVLFQVLKFLLVTVAIYQIGLREQLGLNLEKDYALVNATPLNQLTETGRFTVSFYVLHFFKAYSYFEVEAFAIPDGSTTSQRLTPFGGALAKFSSPPAGTGQPHYFSLVYSLPAGITNNCQVRYAIKFNGDPSTALQGARIRVKHIPPVDLKGLVVPTPLSAVRGQRTEMPESLRGMSLSPASSNAQVRVVADGGKVWVETRGSTGMLPVGTSQVVFQTRAKVAAVDPGKKTIEVDSGGPSNTTIDMSSTALYHFPPNGASPKLISLQDLGNKTGLGIVFTGAVRGGVVNPLQEVRVGDPADPRMSVTMILVIEPNRAPEPVYAAQGSNTFNAFTEEFFGDANTGRQYVYLNLNRIIVDPDGRSPSTGESNIRAQFQVSQNAGECEYGNFKVIREPGSGDYYLEAPVDIRTIMAKHNPSVPLTGIVITATDEMGGHRLPLQIWR